MPTPTYTPTPTPTPNSAMEDSVFDDAMFAVLDWLQVMTTEHQAGVDWIADRHAEVAANAQAAAESETAASTSETNAAESEANAAASEAQTAQDRLDAIAAAALAGVETGLDLTGIPPGATTVVGDEDNITFDTTQKLRAHTYEFEYTASGTFTRPIGLVRAVLEGVGGGGGGGIGGNNNHQMVGAGGGEYWKEEPPAFEFPQQMDITIGAGGAAVTADASVTTPGNDGGDTTIGDLLTARGGKRGDQMSGDVRAGFSGDNPSGRYSSSGSGFSTHPGEGGGAAYSLNAYPTGGNSKLGGPGGGMGGAPGGTSGRGAVGGAGSIGGDGGDGIGIGAGGGSVYDSSGTPTSGAGADGYAKITAYCMLPANTHQFWTDDNTGVLHRVVVTTENGTDYEVDWGDGTISSGTSGMSESHTYAGPFAGFVTIKARARIAVLAFSFGEWAFRTNDFPKTLDTLSVAGGVAGAIFGDFNEMGESLKSVTLSPSTIDATMDFEFWPFAKDDFEKLFYRGTGLTEAEVDRVLKAAESVRSWAVGGEGIDLRGANAIPSAAGLASKAIIEGNGGTVQVNS